MSYSKGIMWLDDCRIPFVDEENIDFNLTVKQSKKNDEYFYEGGFGKEIEKKMYKPLGRFTPNLLVCDDLLNDGSVSKGKVGMTQQSSRNNIYGVFKSKGDTKINDGSEDKGTNSRYYDLDLWFDKMLEKL